MLTDSSSRQSLCRLLAATSSLDFSFFFPFPLASVEVKDPEIHKPTSYYKLFTMLINTVIDNSYLETESKVLTIKITN